MPIEPGLLDTNVLVYALDSTVPQHAASRRLLEAARDAGTILYITSQILCEFFAVVTNVRRVHTPRSPAEARAAIWKILSLPGTHLLPVPVEAVSRWLALVERNPVTGGRVFDLQIVATMQANGIRRIYTFNRADFEIFSELIVTAPPEEP